MPFQLDQEALDSPNMKMLDIGKPPTKSVAFEKFPMMVYLHPKDKTKEHRIATVEDEVELEFREKEGYRRNPHVPMPKPEDFSKDYEVFEPAERPAESLEDMTKADLLSVARERGIKVDPQDKKEVILAAIQAAQPA